MLSQARKQLASVHCKLVNLAVIGWRNIWTVGLASTKPGIARVGGVRCKLLPVPCPVSVTYRPSSAAEKTFEPLHQ
jgi:hypothetical protein